MQRHLAFYKVVEQRDNAPLNTFKTHYCMLNILLLLNTVYQLDGMLIYLMRPQQFLLMMGSQRQFARNYLNILSDGEGYCRRKLTLGTPL